MVTERGDLVARYERYLACCNDRRIDELDELVSDQVSGSGSEDGLAAYLRRIRQVFVGFPDYRWTLQDLVVDEDTVAARLTDEGTHTGWFADIAPTGSRVMIQELVVYRFVDGRIAQCWGDLHAVVRDALRSLPT